MGSFLYINDFGHGGYKVVIVASVLIIMQTLMVGGRLLSRHIQKAPVAADDYLLFLATAIGFGLGGLAITFPRIAGFGAHVDMFGVSGESQGRITGQSYIAWTVIYSFAVATSKCAILLLYIRVFTTRNRVFTVSCFLVGSVIVATCLAYSFIVIFSCAPVNYAWDKSIEGGKCVDLVAFAQYMAIPNVVTGAIMLFMPLPLVWRLKVAVAAKIALTATFLHGIIGFTASCARLTILFRSPASASTNSTALAWTIWTLNEPANYIIAACLPTLRPIFVRVLPPSFFLLSKQRSSKKSSTSAGRKAVSSWPLGGYAKRTYRLDSGSRVAGTDARMSGPWDGSNVDSEKEEGGVEGSLEGDGGSKV